VREYLPSCFGWRRDLPDGRDYGLATAAVSKLLAACAWGNPRATRLPRSIDLREFFPAADDQGPLNASPAFAVLGLWQYFVRRARGQVVVPSRMFLYQIAVRAHGIHGVGDGGAELRSMLKALVRCGTPPEALWPYDPARFDEEPDHPLLYSFAGDYRSIRYWRLDDSQAAPALVLLRVRALLWAGFPSVLGFAVPASLTTSGDIPFRLRLDAVLGGLAAVAAGYDDDRRIGSDKGALLIRCSWGRQWGEAGYGWLPYAVVTSGLAADFWTFFSADWARSGEFGDPSAQLTAAPASARQAFGRSPPLP